MQSGNTHVIGVSGTEGCEIALYLAKNGAKNFHVHDFSAKEEIQKHFNISHAGLSKDEREKKFKQLMRIPAVFHFKEDYLKNIEEAKTVFVPQSWYLYPSNRSLKKLDEQKKLTHLTKLYCTLFPGKIVGITGSNGKTTTSNLVWEIFKNAKERGDLEGNVYFSGNDRRNEQILSQIENATVEDWLILEISNRQLHIDLKKSPNIAVITNIIPTHLSEYESFNEYAQTKLRITEHQTENDILILNSDNSETLEKDIKTKAKILFLSIEKNVQNGAQIKNNDLIIKLNGKEHHICKKSDISLHGEHNIANCLAAALVAFCVGIPMEIVKRSLKAFRGVPQRMELIQTYKDREFYNDTASTNPDSTIAALNAFSQKNIFILGGKSRGGDKEKLIHALNNRALHIVLIQSPLSQELATKLTPQTTVVKTLEQAVKAAWEASKKGDKIIFSPAAEYFSYFQDTMRGYKNYRTFVERICGK